MSSRPKLAWAAGVLALVGGTALIAFSYLGDAALHNFPTYKIERGEFLITATESGEIQAAGGEVIMSPRIDGGLKIIHLWPEGEQVDIGDLILQFDPAEFEVEVINAEGELEKSKAEHEKSRAESEKRLYELEIQLKQQEAGFELTELNLKSLQYRPSIELEKGKIQLEKAQRSLAESRESLAAQKVVNRVDMEKHRQRIERRQQRYDRALDHYKRTSVYAERPGIVVYRKIWKRGTDRRAKVAVGDVVWSGRGLMDIPDLSKMQVLCLIGEVDLKRMHLGQKAFIRLDAFPGPVFHGEMVDLAPLATPQPGAPDIRVFEMLAAIEEKDERLKPGMSAEVEIVLEAIADVLSIPLDAVFAQDGKHVVYRQQGRSFQPVEIALGKRSFTSVIVESGLEENDIIALTNPTQHE